MLVEVSSPADFEKYRGTLKGAIVMNGRPRTGAATSFAPAATRFTDEELTRGSAAIDPGQKVLDNYDGPDYAGAELARRQGLAPRAAIARFFRDEGVAAVLVASPLSSGVIRATDAGGFDLSGPNWKIPNPDLAPPSFVLGREDYGRIARLVERKRPVTVELQLDAEIIRQVRSVNIIAELPGSDAEAGRRARDARRPFRLVAYRHRRHRQRRGQRRDDGGAANPEGDRRRRPAAPSGSRSGTRKKAATSAPARTC